MTPSQIVALVRDLVVLLALAFIVYVLIKFGEDRVTAKDLKAVQTQITTNASTEARWHTEASNANATLNSQVAATTAAVSAQRAPVIVRVPSGSGAVPTAAAAAAGQPAGAGGSAAGPRGDSEPAERDVDVRAAINAFELKYEDDLATCRSVLAQWPQ